MTIPSFNLNHFKVFLAVYQSRSMTVAAETLHLTQSGVSQHMKALEKDLKFQLFTRSGRNLIPTHLADEIFPEIARAFTQVTEKINTVKGTAREPEGPVRIGMPIEFGNNVIIPQLSKLGQEMKKLTFEITFDHALILNRKLNDAELDFAFVDESTPHRRLIYEPVGFEHLLLCAGRGYLSGHPRVTYSQSFFEKLEYIEYTGTEPILRRWMLHHLKRKNLRLNVRAHIMDVQGVAKFITTGLGVGVLPDHVVDKLKKDGVEIYVFEGRTKPLRNEISLARVKDHVLNPAAYAAMTRLRAAL